MRNVPAVARVAVTFITRPATVPDTPPVDNAGTVCTRVPGPTRGDVPRVSTIRSGLSSGTRRPFGTSSSVPWLNVATRSTMRLTLPKALKSLIRPCGETPSITRFGRVCPATRFRLDASGFGAFDG